MNSKELIVQKIANDEVLFCGDSEYDIRQVLESVLGISPDNAQVFGHAYDSSKVFFRIVNENSRPVDFNRDDDVKEFLFNKTSILNAWNLPELIEMFDKLRFDQLAAFAMKDGKAYICLNNMDTDDSKRALVALCDLADEYGCYDDNGVHSSVYSYAVSLENEWYSYLFRHENGSIDASTGLGTMPAKHPNIRFVFPAWLLGAKFAEEESAIMVGFDDLF